MPYTTTIQTVRQSLVDTVGELDAWFESSQESGSYKPLNNRWSINEIIEHVVLTNHYLLIIIRKGRDKALRRAILGEQIAIGESDLTRLIPVGDPKTFP